MNIAVVYSLPTRRAKASPYISADEDTKDSALEVAEALTARGTNVTLVPMTEDSVEALAHIKADLVFNLIEWTGLDLPLSFEAFERLEALALPMTGCSLASLKMVGDKVTMKEMLDEAKIRTPKWQVFKTGHEPLKHDMQYPVIAKLAYEHCSIGLSREAIMAIPAAVVPAVERLIETYEQPVLVEEFIEGREFQVTLLEERHGLTVLPPAEIIFKKPEELTFLTYASRWDEKHADYKASTVALAVLTPELLSELTEMSMKAYHTFECRDYARMDIRTGKKHAYMLEANPNPGLGDSDEYGMTLSYRALGMTFSDFIWEIVESTLRRFDKE